MSQRVINANILGAGCGRANNMVNNLVNLVNNVVNMVNNVANMVNYRGKCG